MNNIQYGKKRKTIIKNLNTKINQWLDSIVDESVKVLAQRDCIVTGGAIASMYLGEKVNDYDIYFKTYETTKAIAEYYCKQYTCEGSGRFPIADDKTYADRITIQIPSAGVAGKPPIQDQDSNDGEENENNTFEENDDDLLYSPIFFSANAITLSNKIQLIVRFNGSPDEIHKNFDFLHAQCYFSLAEQELVASAESLECLLARQLVYRGSLYPLASLFRVKKFILRGWNVSAGDLLKIAWQINDLDMKNPTVLREQLTGVDFAYMAQLIAALAEESPEKINETYVGSIIDKIFS